MRIPLSMLLQGVLLLACAATLPAQKDPVKWGDVPAEDLAMTTFAADTAADAVVLADYGILRFEFSDNGPAYLLERHRRVKLLRRPAFGRGDVSLTYYSYQKIEEISNLRAQVINPGGQVTVLRGKDFFEEKVSDRVTRIRFTFPGLVEGSVIEYQYKEKSTSVHTLPEWYFQEDIPVRWSEYRLVIPEWLQYVTLTQGRKFDVEEHSASAGEVYYRDNTANGSSGNVKVVMNHHRYVMHDVPALREEAYITTMDDYLARLRFQLSATKFNEVYKPFLSTWEETARELMTHGKFGEQFTKSRNYKDFLAAAAPAMAGAATDAEKLARAYDFLSRQVEWNEKHGVFVTDDLDACFRQRKGHSGELNLLLIALLREYGVAALPVLVSTRGHGRMLQQYPILDQFDHVLAMVPVDGRELPVDLGSPYRPPGLLRVSSLNSHGWVVDPAAPRWVDLPAQESKQITMAELSIDENGDLRGHLRQMFGGYRGAAERESFAAAKKGEHLMTGLREYFPEAVVDSFRVDKLERTGEAMVIDIFCRMPQAAPAAVDFLYVSALPLPPVTENPFRIEKRLFPVDIPYPLNEQFVMTLTIPEGYTVEETPQPVSLVTEGEGARFQFFVTKKSERELQVVCRLLIRQLHYEPEQYPMLREIFARLLQKQEEQIVLRKKS